MIGQIWEFRHGGLFNDPSRMFRVEHFVCAMGAAVVTINHVLAPHFKIMNISLNSFRKQFVRVQ